MNSYPLKQAFRDAQVQMEAGQPWRAKEILHKQIKYADYNVELYERLGSVLMNMSDLFEAGKYLFLSGVRKPEYEEPIQTFLVEYKDKPQNLFHPFPRAAKLAALTDYPEAVQKTFRDLGFPYDLGTVHQIGRPRSTSSSNKLAAIIFFTVFLLILALIILGIIKLKEIIF